MNLTQGDIKSQLIKIAFPAGIGMMFHTFYNITDTFYAGLIGSEAIGAMAITFPVFFILLALAIGFSQGTTALISNYIGAKDIKNACEVYIQALIYSLFISIAIGLLIFYSSEWIFNFFGAEGDFLMMAISYISVIALGAPFMILNLVVNSALNSIGDTKKNRNIMVFGFFLNIGLNPLLCFGLFFIPALGIAGIALSTVIVQVIATIYLFYYVLKTEMLKNFNISMLKIKMHFLKSFVSQSLPMCTSYLMIAFGFFVLTKFVTLYGSSAAAAFGIACRIEELILLPTIGLNTALLSIVGQSYGAQKIQRVRESYMMALKIGMLMMFFGFLVLITFGGYLSSLFTKDIEVINISKDYLFIFAFSTFFFVIIHMSGSIFQGIKKPFYTTLYAFIRLGILPITLLYTINTYFNFGINGIWIGMLLINIVVAIIIFYHLRKILFSIEKKSKI